MRPCVPRGRRVEVILTMAVSEAIENYLETIYILSEQQNEVHAIDVCSYLSYSRPTVSIVLRQMRESGLVTVHEDNHIHLTEEGRALAMELETQRDELSVLFCRSFSRSPEEGVKAALLLISELNDESIDKLRGAFRAMPREAK